MSRLSAIALTGIHETAVQLRRGLAALFCCHHPENMVLAPGTTIALKTLLSGMEIKSLMLGPNEYCSEQHFAPLTVSISTEEAMIRDIEMTRPEAVLLSIVSWQGKQFPLPSIFRQLRERFGDACPLLIADYSHAGSIGFPEIDVLGADVVVGDLSKWVLIPGVADELCFLYPVSARIAATCLTLFAPLFLATTLNIDRSDRWVMPEQLERAAAWFSISKLSRESLLEQYQRNRAMAFALAPNSKWSDPEVCILWFQDVTAIPTEIPEELLWPTQNGIRLMCREDVLGIQTQVGSGRWHTQES